MTNGFVIEPLSEDALLLRFGDSIDPAVNARVHAAARALRDAALPGVTDIAPAYASLLVRFDLSVWSDAADSAPFARISARLVALVGSIAPSEPSPLPHSRGERGSRGTGGLSPVIDLPVCYSGEFAPDLATVAAHAGLSSDEVVARHTAAEYTVAMLGFAPGFPYLLGLDKSLHMPRRASPRTRVPPGSVAIGGAQTGIYPGELPGGWHLLGRTPRALFDPQRDPPALLAPGDRVRFQAIDADEFARLAERKA